MNFKFNYTLCDREFLEFKLLSAQVSPNFKKMITTARLTVWATILLLSVVYYLGKGHLGGEHIILFAVHVLFGLALMPFAKPFVIYLIKKKVLKSTENKKAQFSPVGYMEFGVNEFAEFTQNTVIRRKYESIESVEILDGRYVWLKSSDFTHILPFTAFENQMQYAEFISFLKTVCPNVNIHNGIIENEIKKAKRTDKILFILKIVTSVTLLTSTAFMYYPMISWYVRDGGHNVESENIYGMWTFAMIIYMLIYSAVHITLAVSGVIITASNVESKKRLRNMITFIILGTLPIVICCLYWTIFYAVFVI